MSTRYRFAPSPTGYLHVGNARLALINWLSAKKDGGEMILRLDDTDEDRSTEAYAAAIQEDLKWLGLDWSELKKQSERSEAYRRAFETLKAAGRLYPCYETGEELDYKRKRRLARKLPPVYDRAALELTEADKAKLEAEGRKPHWRFKLDQVVIRWEDMVRGSVEVDGASMSDPVLIRSDGRPLYHMPSVVDDIDFAITHVIRGEDHVSNTALHIQIFEALGASVPTFGHIPLLMGPDGGPLSKREGSQSLRELRANGIEAMAVDSLLARLGTSENVEICHSLEEIVAGFDIHHFSRAAAKFDPAELANLNAKLLHQLDWAEVKDRLAIPGADETFWNAVRGNLTKLDDAKDWWQVVRGPMTPVVENADFLRAAAEQLPDGEITPESWKAWTTAVKETTGAKGKALFMPLRLALTGRPHGPEMNNLLPLIGRENILARLTGRAG
ncbi:glutamate--tRNA ligase [Sneathiella chungangensis]|uniref:Glutamate--tRNA ligase n=1 Tax=Sneathiella chungangensis TaxID=1418234 RepID=A0A845M6D3_9PROT|nr:glutamate--tRNA ligase [Sneathiella chungangensis]MZR20823.1 glutamate--tRNA ligase [Sneathiella chungangensis]